MDVVLKVPVRSFVYKYITAKYGSPWRLSSRHKDGRLLQEFLARTPNRYERFAKNDRILEIIVPSKIMLTKGCYLSQSKIDSFNEIIYSDLLNEIEGFYTAVTSGIGIKKCNKVRVIISDKNEKIRERRVSPVEGSKFFAQKEIIQSFLKKYDITEEDLTYDAMIKKLQRSLVHKN